MSFDDAVSAPSITEWSTEELRRHGWRVVGHGADELAVAMRPVPHRRCRCTRMTCTNDASQEDRLCDGCREECR